jgi:ABC-type antimicrobial peptide transport system permease subunit
VTLGGLVGLAAFIVLSRFLSSQLYGVRASDPLAILLTLGLLFQTALLACLGPALRAARVAPAEALRAM